MIQDLPATPWSLSSAEAAERLGVDPAVGLDAAELRARKRRFGPNHLRRQAAKGAWRIAYDQLASPLVVLLALAALLSVAFGHWVEAGAIAAVILINALIGFFTELRAVRSMEALTRLGSRRSRVRREGEEHEITARGLMPGDVVLLDAGDVVSADLRLIEASKVLADESILTGESEAVDKTSEALGPEVPLAERRNLLFKGTWLTRGSAVGLVVATGMQTELGKIASLAAEVAEEETPLERRLERLSQRLIGFVLLVAGLVILSGLWTDRPFLLLIETAIALAVSAVPEGLPIIATVALARGMQRMARKNALVRRLSAVETLGGTSVIFTDKTGTLTENRMRLVRVALLDRELEVGAKGFSDERGPLDLAAQPALTRLLEVGVLCNNAALREDDDEDGVGDPLEVALLAWGARAGLKRPALLAREPELSEIAFDPETKRMGTLHRVGDGAVRLAVKGAPEAVLDVSTGELTPEGERRALDDDGRQRWLEAAQRLAGEGLRVLALAERGDAPPDAGIEQLTMLGLVGLHDPPRADVAAAISACREAGIRVVMATGDHPRTALAIARAVGIVEETADDVLTGESVLAPDALTPAQAERLRSASILARTSPEQKLNLIALHQAEGAIVAMTGDGVNDAPALRKADIGVAMGGRGTEVAREASQMVLKDDAFGTIVLAVREGRVIFRNIRQFVVYLMSCNLSEILVIAIAVPLGTALPLLPLQILFLNLVTDVFPALALGAGSGPRDIMRRAPRPADEPIVGPAEWRRIIGFALLITACTLAAYLLALGPLQLGAAGAMTVTFLTLALAQTLHVLNMRSAGTSLTDNEVSRNPWAWGAIALCVGLLVLAVYLPGLSRVLSTVPPGLSGWSLVLALGGLPVVVGQLWLSLSARPTGD